jgi:hypothetical protein
VSHQRIVVNEEGDSLGTERKGSFYRWKPLPVDIGEDIEEWED